MDSVEFSSVFKQKLLTVLEYTLNFFERNQIRCFACGGTVLGAVRHQGFIPWDDDIDLYVPREDYIRLVNLNKDLQRDGYSFVCLENDANYYLSFGKIIDMNTSLWEFEKYPYMLGAYLDIFPLDFFSGTDAEITKEQMSYTAIYHEYNLTLEKPRWRRLLRDALFFEWSDGIKRSKYYFETYRKRAHDNYYQEVLKYLHSIEKEGNKCVCLSTWIGKIFETEWFEKAVYLPFEHLQLLVPRDYDAYLSLLYGDYMTPPPVSARSASHDYARYYLNLRERVSIKEAENRIRKGERLVY